MTTIRSIRKSLRLPHFDYSSNGAYFVTICSHNRAQIFAHKTNGELTRSVAGQYVIDTWSNIALHHPEVILDEHVIMPNHFHGILFIQIDDLVRAERERAGHGPAPTLPNLMRELKSFSANKINRALGTRGQPVWQRSYWERVIRNDQELDLIREYIRRNPENWEQDREKVEQRLVGDGP